jgi:hypothetical protein
MIRGIDLRPIALLLAVLLVRSPVQARPFFLYGAAFFYERVPRDRWAASLRQYRAMGINTIDLYVMWNWHEPREGQFDFTGRTNPRRDLVGLLRLIDRDGFRVVLRPGPVIRNEWRNGGYPAWLLERAQYHMPLRDVLEGRYPATATLQNQHSDAAAAEWLHNPIHMRYATQWLERVYRTVAPWRKDVYAIALDDDQGAYLDNDTWPAPHFHQYIRYLQYVANRALPGIPVFINTYDMKVTASAPVWPWSTWYQSDAYSIGEHDRTQLEFTAGLLQTQPAPLMFAEFQAGWLQGADQPLPPPADPANTTLALHTLLQMGVHGVVNFPVQDTFYPAGWEAPWTNAFYSWDAALAVQLTPQQRWRPTARFGSLLTRYGAQLAQTHRAQDAAIAYLTSAYEPSRLSNDDVAHIAQATMQAQRGCRIMRISCGLIDLRYASAAQLAAFPVLIVPPNDVHAKFITAVGSKLQAYRARRGRVVSSARFAHVAHPVAGGIPDAALLVAGDHRFGFVDIVNYARTPLRIAAARVHEGAFEAAVPARTVPPRDAVLVPLELHAQLDAARAPTIPRDRKEGIPLRVGSWIPATFHRGNGVYRADVYSDGYPAVVFQNAGLRLIVSPCAGARAFVFEDLRTGRNLFTTIGGLRDAWLQTLPPSARDYIGKYTHPIPTGTFNRCYGTSIDTERRAAVFAYTALDAPPHGGAFRKRIVLERNGFTVAFGASFAGSYTQRAQELTSLAIDRSTRIIRIANGIAFLEPAQRRIVQVTWRPGDVQGIDIRRHSADALLTLTFVREPQVVVRYRVQAVTRKGANRP